MTSPLDRLWTYAYLSIARSLAYCEIYLTLAHLFRRYDIELFGTMRADMEWKDCMIPKRKGDLKVVLKRAEG